MRIAKNDVPIKIEVPGAVARHQADSGDASGSGKMAGEFYWPPGHTVRAEEESEVILFSPQHEHAEVIAHIQGKLGV